MSNRLFILTFFIVLIFSCNSAKEKNTLKNIESFPVITVLVRDTTIQTEYVSDIHAIENVEIRARVSGFLNKVFVDEGQEVYKGQPLFLLNDEEYKAELAKSKAFLNKAIAEAKAAALEVDKVKMLVEKKVISKTELEVAEAKLVAANSKIEEARSAVSNASIRLSYAYIKAPFKGVIDRIPLKVGSLINEGTLLTTISNTKNVYAYFNVSESEYLHYIKSKLNSSLNNNINVQMILADGSTYEHLGKIETMDGEFEPNTGSIAFRAKFPNPNKILKHGSTGKIKVSTLIKNALIIPQKSVFEVQDKNYVYVVDTNNKVSVRSFIPERRISNFYIIKSGLTAGEKVIFEGIQNIKDGDIIKPTLIAADSLIRLE